MTRHRQIGRKVMQADRLAYVLDMKNGRASNDKWYASFMRRRTIAFVCAGIMIVGALSFGISQFNSSQNAAAQQAVDTAQRIDGEAKTSAAACRQKKAEEKADLIGKVTYNELYDYAECDG